MRYKNNIKVEFIRELKIGLISENQLMECSHIKRIKEEKHLTSTTDMNFLDLKRGYKKGSLPH
jgi:hypothetical protein